MILQIRYKDIASIADEAEKALKLKLLPTCTYWGYFYAGEIVGFVSLLLYANKAKLHSSYVKPSFRGQRIYDKLNQVRWKAINDLGIKKVEANCTPMSLDYHLKRGAKAGKQYKICTQIDYSL